MNRAIPSNFVKSVLHNGVGRYVCQLQRVTLKFCKSHGCSQGIREFIERDLLQFTRDNPGIVVYLQPNRHKSPLLVGEYMNGNKVDILVKSSKREEVGQWMEHLRARSGIEIERLRKHWHTDTPSIQGIWTPYTNRDSSLNMREFPDKELSEYIPLEKSGQEKLLEFMEMRNLNISTSEEPERIAQNQ